MAPVYGFLFLLFSHLVLLAARDGNGYQGECPPSFDCGYLHNISFPFTKTGHQDCGLLTIQNCDDSTKRKEIQLENNGKRFEVMQVFQFHPALSTIQIRDNDLYKLLQSRNCAAFYNYTIPASFRFASFRLTSNSSLFKCNRTLHVNPTKDIYNYTGCPDYNLYYGPSITDGPVSSLTACTMIDLPSKDLPDAKDPFTFISANILIEVHLSDECANCHYYKRGQCHFNSKGKFFCANGYEKTGKMKLIVATAASAVGVAVLMVLALLFRTKTFPTAYLLFWKKENPTHHIIEAFLKEHGPLPTVRYSYLEVKKMTNSFRNKLGQGGYGNVYKGKLHDGCLVAVKVLNESKGNGEDFINEVASISRTSHVNIVSLMGFCLEGSKMALIYEFMPNGSLEKFIYEEKIPSVIDRQFNCKTLYDIAIGVARGLEYLHRGCNTRILHFDIKPHNILLDEDFCPKISDFGLAKICPRKESIVSILDVRGTVGYIAPELFSRNFGGVSHKSDVYSYGMMVLEMVGGRQNNNVQADCSSEIYFPHWIYKRLELNQELGLWYIKNESDKEMVRKMTVVSLWCIQPKPSSRPTMSKVVEMLEGSLEVLQIPPKTYLSSPSTSPAHFSCETCESL